MRSRPRLSPGSIRPDLRMWCHSFFDTVDAVAMIESIRSVGGAFHGAQENGWDGKPHASEGAGTRMHGIGLHAEPLCECEILATPTSGYPLRMLGERAWGDFRREGRGMHPSPDLSNHHRLLACLMHVSGPGNRPGSIMGKDVRMAERYRSADTVSVRPGGKIWERNPARDRVWGSLSGI